MSLPTIHYHILFFNETPQPYQDCQHEAHISNDSTYNDFIDCIIKGLGKFESYNDIPKAIRKNRNNITITIGPKAKQQRDIMKQTVTNHRTVQLNDIVNVPRHKCVYFIITKQKHNHTIKNTKKAPTPNKNKHKNTNKKRSRNAIKNNSNNTNQKLKAPPPKRRKKEKAILTHSKPHNSERNKSSTHGLQYECLWILTDATTLNDEYEQNMSDTMNRISGVSKVKECIGNIINNNWIKKDCPTHYIALYSYGTDLIEETKLLSYSNENKAVILNCLDNINNTKSMSWTNALFELINVIECEKYNISNHRIVLFCGKYIKTRLNANEKIVLNNIKNKLLTLNIIFDCIQMTSSYRLNKDLFETADRYWSNIQKTVVLCPDFMYPNKRNVKKEEAIVID